MYPNKEQIINFHKHFGACRYIYNWGLEYKIRIYKEKGKFISYFALNKKITKLKLSKNGYRKWTANRYRELHLILSMLLQCFSKRKRVFLSSNQIKVQYNHSTFHIRHRVDFENNRVRLSKIGWVKTKLYSSLRVKNRQQ